MVQPRALLFVLLCVVGTLASHAAAPSQEATLASPLVEPARASPNARRLLMLGRDDDTRPPGGEGGSTNPPGRTFILRVKCTSYEQTFCVDGGVIGVPLSYPIYGTACPNDPRMEVFYFYPFVQSLAAARASSVYMQHDVLTQYQDTSGISDPNWQSGIRLSTSSYVGKAVWGKVVLYDYDTFGDDDPIAISNSRCNSIIFRKVPSGALSLYAGCGDDSPLEGPLFGPTYQQVRNLANADFYYDAARIGLSITLEYV